MSSKEILKLNPPGTIGIIGGGQLGRMMAFEAKRMGYQVIVLDPTENAPCGQVCDEQIVAAFDDLEALRQLAKKSDVLTYEFEHIDVESLYMLEEEGYKIYPSAHTLKKINNKYLQKKMLFEAGIAVPALHDVTSLEDLKTFFHTSGEKVIMKTCLGGYDGKGNAIVRSVEELEKQYQRFKGHAIFCEELVDFEKEVSVLIAKNYQQSTVYPIAENIHKDSILIKSIIPARVSKETEEKIKELACQVSEVLEDYGIFCIEMFVDRGGNVSVNEIAPRPHNSGHYTIEGCITSQFEQIIRVITGMPLGSTRLRKPCVMVNVLGDRNTESHYAMEGIDSILALEDCHLHLYGKVGIKTLRKIGHITALGDSLEEADQKASTALKRIKTVL